MTTSGTEPCINGVMMHYRNALATIFVLIFIPAAFAASGDFKPDGWNIPQLYGATRYSDEMVDFDSTVPGKETRVEKFTTLDGGRVHRYSHNGYVFSYEVDSDQEDPLDYELVDYDGSGIFEMKQSPYDEYPLPFWTRR